VATFAQWATGPREPRVDALECGWLWGSPLPNGAYSAIAFTRDGRGYDEMIASSELFRDLRDRSDVRTCDATSYAALTPATETSICVGEASYSIDPLSSSGVQSAIQSAIHASIVINTILRRPHDAQNAIRFYAEAQRTAIARHARWTADAYANSRFRDAPFWRMRAVAPALDDSPRAPLRAVGDFIEA
jgi:flavin-dependent dehydrogenase